MPRVAEQLHTRLIIPPHAEVANAVGAVAGGVVQRQRVLITPLDDGEALRLHLPEGVRDFRDLEEAVAYAQAGRWSPGWTSSARQAGADQVEVQMAREDKEVLVQAGLGRPALPGHRADLYRGRAGPARPPGRSGAMRGKEVRPDEKVHRRGRQRGRGQVHADPAC